MAARFIVSNYQNRRGNARTSVLMSREDALQLAVKDPDTVEALSEAFAQAETQADDEE
jgi:hypothetical protein